MAFEYSTTIKPLKDVITAITRFYIVQEKVYKVAPKTEMLIYMQ